MATTSKTIIPNTMAFPAAQKASNIWHTVTHKQLNATFETAPIIPYDDTSRFIFFGDLHRGDGGPADAFVRNAGLFQDVLRHYYRCGYTYVEVGDGDELWKNHKFSTIHKAHKPTFDLLHKFDMQKRLHLILGNHDIVASRKDCTEKDGMSTTEGLILEHSHTGQQICVAHGHQADIKSHQLYKMSRLVIRYIWKNIQLLGLFRHKHHISRGLAQRPIENRLVAWVRSQRKVLICAHTHQPRSTVDAAVPYFNTGCCITLGELTGLEIQSGDILLVKWTLQKHGSIQRIQRELIASPRKLKIL
jgi:UDP-2,3-diacylglucosamine pyrophosphatase LpxH